MRSESPKTFVFSEFEIARFSKVMRAYLEKRRPPAHIRSELDFDFKIDGDSVELFEIKPFWRDRSKKIEHSIAKATYKSDNTWLVFWKRGDLSWHLYQPTPSVKTLEEFLSVIEKDNHGAFFG